MRKAMHPGPSAGALYLETLQPAVEVVSIRGFRMPAIQKGLWITSMRNQATTRPKDLGLVPLGGWDASLKSSISPATIRRSSSLAGVSPRDRSKVSAASKNLSLRRSSESTHVTTENCSRPTSSPASLTEQFTPCPTRRCLTLEVRQNRSPSRTEWSRREWLDSPDGPDRRDSESGGLCAPSRRHAHG